MEETAPSNDQGAEASLDDVIVDVRPLIQRGEEPFGTVMKAVETLDGRALVVVAPFEPTPLEGVLGAQGFAYRAERVGDTEWRVRFERADEPGPPAPAAEPSPFTIRRPQPQAGGAPTPQAGPSTAAPRMPPVLPAAAMAMNPTLNVPPAWLPLGFMAAAALGLIGFGTAVLLAAPTALSTPQTDTVIAAVHLGVLAFLSTAVLGALHQFGPVVGGRPLRSVGAGVATGLLFVPAAWLIPIGFTTGHLGVVQAGGVMATVAVCVAAWNVSRPLAASGKGAPIIGLRLAVAYLVLTAAFGVTYAFNRGSFWFALLPNRVLAHAHLGLLGWLGLSYVAVAEKLWPMFLLAHRPSVRHGERAVWLVGSGAVVAGAGLLWAITPLGVLGGAIAVSGLAFHLASLASVIRHRRRGLELLHGFVLVSAACLATAVVVGVVAGVAPTSASTRTRLVTAEVFTLILWLGLAVVGHAHKIVPFISWNRLRDRGVRTGRDGKPLLFAHLVNGPMARATLTMAVLGAVCGVVGTLSATSALLRLAGAALAMTGVLAGANLVSGPLLMIRWHNTHLVAPPPDKESDHGTDE